MTNDNRIWLSKWAAFFGAVYLCFNGMGCGRNDPDQQLWKGEDMPGGELTVWDGGPNSFGHPAPALGGMDELEFFVGNSFFNQNWVSSPASTTARDGLGPLFNARSCSGCHFKDGRGRAPEFPGELVTGYLVRLSIDGWGPHGENLPEPAYGGQLQDQALPNIPVEAFVEIQYTLRTETYEDGSLCQLREPNVVFSQWQYGNPDPSMQYSARVANQMIGLGLLESIPEQAILWLSDPTDSDGDGISGRPNYVWDHSVQQRVLGRFGWKAGQPTLIQQIAAAFQGDMGITTTLFPDQNCTALQPDCQAAPDGGHPEIPDDDLAKVLLYSRSLGVPARRNPEDPAILRGRNTFIQLGCGKCHRPSYATGDEGPAFLQGQIIYPYTDLLLHDMGEGLADHRPEFEATGTEWRTPPLWGIGLIPVVNGHSSLLHDGRARSVEEAILWHGGEAAQTQLAFKQLSAAERQELIQFIESL